MGFGKLQPRTLSTLIQNLLGHPVRRPARPSCEIPKFLEVNEYIMTQTQWEIFSAEKTFTGFAFRSKERWFRMNSFVFGRRRIMTPWQIWKLDRVKILAWNNQTLSSYFAKLAILFSCCISKERNIFVFMENLMTWLFTPVCRCKLKKLIYK